MSPAFVFVMLLEQKDITHSMLLYVQRFLIAFIICLINNSASLIRTYGSFTNIDNNSPIIITLAPENCSITSGSSLIIIFAN